MTDIAAVFLSTSVSGLFCVWADWHAFRKGFFPIGTIVLIIFSITYGLGWLLWRIDPDSLFGYSSKATLSALSGMGISYALGIFTLSFTYLVARSLLPRQYICFSPFDILARNSNRLVSYVVFIITVSVAIIPLLFNAGMFSRETGVASLNVLPIDYIVSVVKGTTLLSRLFPVALLLLPSVLKNCSKGCKMIVITLLSIFVCMAYATGSRTLLFTVPAYLTVGFLFWYRPKLSKILITTVLAVVLFIPVAEHIRVQREGDSSIPDLSRKYQLFQIGKQLIGTSHDFYLYLDPNSCQDDLSELIAKDPLSKQISTVGARSFPSESFQRWHISGRLTACSSRRLEPRLWTSLSHFPAGLLPKTLGFPGPSLFDGQNLSYELSRSLDLKPGEISNSTLSLFADSWWRYRWLGVTIAFTFLGLLLALIQTLIDSQIAKAALAGLVYQMILFTLLGSWINNTALTTLWLLFWELPKSFVICYLLILFLGFARRSLPKC